MLTATLTYASSLITLLASATHYVVGLEKINKVCSHPSDMQELGPFSQLVVGDKSLCT